MTEREKYLEDLISQSFLDEEGEHICLAGEGECNFCEIKGLCDEAAYIIKKESAAK